ncbi:MAG: hypothetical protein WKF89_18920 [Chitinophagaceae bacterium]
MKKQVAFTDGPELMDALKPGVHATVYRSRRKDNSHSVVKLIPKPVLLGRTGDD